MTESLKEQAIILETAKIAHKIVVACAGPAQVFGIEMPEIEVDTGVKAAAMHLAEIRAQLGKESASQRVPHRQHSGLKAYLARKQKEHDAMLANRTTGDEADIALLAEEIKELPAQIEQARLEAEALAPVETLRLYKLAEKKLVREQLRAALEAKQLYLQALEAGVAAGVDHD